MVCSFKGSSLSTFLSSYMAHIHITSCSFPLFLSHPGMSYEPSANFSNPSKSMLFGRSIGSPKALSHINCASGPRPRETPKVAV